jgi:hypothetical protein
MTLVAEASFDVAALILGGLLMLGALAKAGWACSTSTRARASSTISRWPR